MEMNQKLNWNFTCEFSIFAQAYTGLQDTEEIMACIEENDQIAIVDEPDKFMAKNDMMKVWHENVTFQPNYIMENNGITFLEMYVCTGDTSFELECDCVEPEEMLKEIIKLIYK